MCTTQLRGMVPIFDINPARHSLSAGVLVRTLSLSRTHYLFSAGEWCRSATSSALLASGGAETDWFAPMPPMHDRGMVPIFDNNSFCPSLSLGVLVRTLSLSLSNALSLSGRGMVPIFDINRFAKSAGKWLHRRQVHCAKA